MREITHTVDTKVVDGKLTKIVRNYFVYNSINWLVEAQSHFTKKEKKEAKLSHRLKYGI